MAKRETTARELEDYLAEVKDWKIYKVNPYIDRLSRKIIQMKKDNVKTSNMPLPVPPPPKY